MEQTKTDNTEYKTGYVYSIRSFNTDKIYIGSTFQKLSKRLCEHRGYYKRWCNDNTKNCTSSKIIFEAGNPYIELIKEVKAMNRYELRKYEGEEQRKHKNILVNIHFENPTEEEQKAQSIKSSKKYYEKNKDKVQKYQKEYRPMYQKKHRDKLLEQSKKYYYEHTEQSKARVNCLECNILTSKRHLKRHLRTKKHIENSKTEI